MKKKTALYKEIWYLNPSNYDYVVGSSTFSIPTLAEISGVNESELKGELAYFVHLHRDSSSQSDDSQPDDSIESDDENDEADKQQFEFGVFCKGHCSNVLVAFSKSWLPTGTTAVATTIVTNV